MWRTINIFALAGYFLIAPCNPLQADGTLRPWDDRQNGTIEVAPVGNVSYEIGFSNIGFGHFATGVSVSWEDDGRRSQLLFDGIDDKPPAKVTAIGSQLCISVAQCGRYQDDCPIWSTRYHYDVADKAFVRGEEGQQACPR